MNQSPKSDRISLGVLLILVSTLMTATQEATFKFASADLSIWQLFVIRSAFLIPAFLVLGALGKPDEPTLRSALRVGPLLRASMLLGMFFAAYGLMPFLPLATIGAGIYTAPLFVAALSAWLLREPVGIRGVGAIAIGFIGVLVILRPGTDAFSPLILVAVLGGFCYALAGMFTRKLCRSVPPVALALSLMIVVLVAGIVLSLALIVWPPSIEMAVQTPFLFGGWGAINSAEWAVIGILVAVMVVNGIVLPAAYQSAPTVIIITFDYCYLIFATLFGIFLFNEIPDAMTLIGMCLIAGAGLMIVWRKV